MRRARRAAALDLRDLERIDGRARHPDRHRPRPPAQRHVRPRDAADVRVPRRRGEPRRPPDVEGAARRHLRRRRRPRDGRRGLHLAELCRTSRSRARRPDRRVRAPRARWSAHRGARRGSSCRSSAGATSSPRSTRASTRRVAGEGRDRRHRGRGRDGQVAARRRVRARRPPARADRRVRRMPVVRDETPLLRLARDLAAPVRPRERRARRAPAAPRWRRARRDRPGARRARAAARARPRARDPGHRADRVVRREAAQDVARGPAGDCLRARQRRAARRRARGLPLDRRAVARPARGPRARIGGVAAGPARPRLSAGGRARWRPRRRAAPGLRGDRARRARRADDAARASIAARRSQQLDRCDASRGRRRRWSSSSLERSEGNPFYVEELLSFIAAQASTSATRRAARRSSSRRASTASSSARIDTVAEEPRRTLKVASVVGRVFEAPMLPGRLPGARGPRRGPRPPGHAPGGRPRRLDREAEQAYLFKHVVTQEVAYESMPFALRAIAARPGRRLPRAAEPEAIEQQLDLLAHHFWLSDDEAEAARTSARAADAARRPTRTTRRSGTWSA